MKKILAILTTAIFASTISLSAIANDKIATLENEEEIMINEGSVQVQDVKPGIDMNGPNDNKDTIEEFEEEIEETVPYIEPIEELEEEAEINPYEEFEEETDINNNREIEILEFEEVEMNPYLENLEEQKEDLASIEENEENILYTDKNGLRIRSNINTLVKLVN